MSKKEAKPDPQDIFSALPPGFIDNPLTKSVRASAQQIWAAGLGAFSKAGGSGKLFESLVNEGLKLQQKTHTMAKEKLSDLSNASEDIGGKARKQWSQLESLFEQRVQQALNSMGMPTVTEVRELHDRLDALSAEVAALKGKATPVKPTASKTATIAAAPAKKAAAKKVPAKKVAAKKPKAGSLAA
ncbi:MAG TPA: phasin family protein [Burkholderiaceae bacterium]|jgi:poly(hydroxyalkanoate) granule-associated protein